MTITESGDPEYLYRPHYEQSKSFFLWGFVGEHRINTQEICGQREVAQMRTHYSATDVLYTVLTLGIYIPRNGDSNGASEQRNHEPEIY